MENDGTAPDQEISGGRKVFSVSELTEQIKGLLEGEFPGVWVEGEVSNLSTPPSGHMYFSLKDGKAQIRGVMWKGMRSRASYTPKDGDKVMVRGRISVYSPRGEYQLVAESIEPKGLGALQAAFEALKKKLKEEGLFDQDRKKPLPFIPWSVGIVTAEKGAAIADMIRTIRRRFPGLRIVINPTPVQGKGAAEKIAQAIDELNQYGKVDVIIAGRGGGSLEDLWAFNEEPVARAIARSKIPVVSAVGHEVDFTIADFVADIRASTPTAAAELVAPDKAALARRVEELQRKLGLEIRDKLEADLQYVDDLSNRIVSSSRNTLELSRHRLAAAMGGLRGQNPATKVRMRLQRLAELSAAMNNGLKRSAHMKRLKAETMAARLGAIRPLSWVGGRKDVLARSETALIKAAGSDIRSRRQALEKLSEALNAYDPTKVLDRGYAIVTRAGGGVVRKVEDMPAGTRVEIRVSDGKAQARVEGKKEERQQDLF